MSFEERVAKRFPSFNDRDNFVGGVLDGTREIQVRVVDRTFPGHSKPKRFLDVREHITSSSYTGYTKRGITFTKEQLSGLIPHLKEALKLLPDEG